MKHSKHNSLGRLTKKICSDICRSIRHYLFLEAPSFPRASSLENCSLLGTDNIRGQISEHIFAPNGGYCLHNLAFKYDKGGDSVLLRQAHFLRELPCFSIFTLSQIAGLICIMICKP